MSESTEKPEGKKLGLVGFGLKIGINRKARRESSWDWWDSD